MKFYGPLSVAVIICQVWYFWIEHSLNKDVSQNETKNSKDLYIFLYGLTTKQDLHKCVLTLH